MRGAFAGWQSPEKRYPAPRSRKLTSLTPSKQPAPFAEEDAKVVVVVKRGDGGSRVLLLAAPRVVAATSLGNAPRTHQQNKQTRLGWGWGAVVLLWLCKASRGLRGSLWGRGFGGPRWAQKAILGALHLSREALPPNPPHHSELRASSTLSQSSSSSPTSENSSAACVSQVAQCAAMYLVCGS